MRKICALIAAAMLTCIGIDPAQSQGIFPSQKELTVTITPRVVKTSTGQFEFLYTILNHKTSKQVLERIYFENKAPIAEIIKPNDWTLCKYLASWPDTTATPRHIAWTPAVFHGDVGLNAPAQAPPIESIVPGEVSGEFGLIGNDGPPAIIEWKVKGWAPLPVYDEERDVIISNGVEYPVEDVADTLLDHRETIPNSNPAKNAVTGKTLGPSMPPTAKSLCDTFILDLIGQVREAVAAGWIKHDLRKDRDDDERVDEGNPTKSMDGRERDDDHADDDVDMDAADKNLPGVVPSEIRDILSRSGDGALPGAAKSIIQKLTKVRRECMRGKASTAREKLRALIAQVNAQRQNHLTDEAYYLIRFNAEFLLEKL